MIVGIHQPQYLPWLPYFLKIDQSDIFVLLDSVDYQKNGVQNRNKIKTGNDSHWLTVPVIKKSKQKINEIKINNNINWRYKHFQTIKQNYSKAKSFSSYEKDLNYIYSLEWNKLSELNIELIKMMMSWMNIKTPLLRSSEMGIKGNKSELILNLCLEIGAKKYLSGSGGKNYLKTESFNKKNIEIVYQSIISEFQYPQLNSDNLFLNDLSALDIMFNAGSKWKNYLPREFINNE